MVSATIAHWRSAIANAFSIPIADSRIGISQIGRVMPYSALISAMLPADFDDLLRIFGLGKQNQVRSFGNDLFQILEAERKLVDAHHALAAPKIDGAQAHCAPESRARPSRRGAPNLPDRR